MAKPPKVSPYATPKPPGSKKRSYYLSTSPGFGSFSASTTGKKGTTVSLSASKSSATASVKIPLRRKSKPRS